MCPEIAPDNTYIQINRQGVAAPETLHRVRACLIPCHNVKDAVASTIIAVPLPSCARRLNRGFCPVTIFPSIYHIRCANGPHASGGRQPPDQFPYSAKIRIICGRDSCHCHLAAQHRLLQRQQIFRQKRLMLLLKSNPRLWTSFEGGIIVKLRMWSGNGRT